MQCYRIQCGDVCECLTCTHSGTISERIAFKADTLASPCTHPHRLRVREPSSNDPSSRLYRRDNTANTTYSAARMSPPRACAMRLTTHSFVAMCCAHSIRRGCLFSQRDEEYRLLLLLEGVLELMLMTLQPLL